MTLPLSFTSLTSLLPIPLSIYICMYMYIVYTLELVLYGSALYPIYDPSPFFYLSHLSPSYPSLPSLSPSLLPIPLSLPSLPLSLPPSLPPPLPPSPSLPPSLSWS